ncbi:MAG: hypothetical protein DMF49_13455 [Acidobacteria bacterium]|nr:MAG: hypothetical protein DMF49_13455 [Acidobacteriota bacterium]
MASFTAALRTLNEMKATGVVEDYAVAGAMAVAFWTEPLPTFDLDVLIFLPGEQQSPIITLEPIYRWASERGFLLQAEHVLIEGVPVQFLPAYNALADEAIETRPRPSAELIASLREAKADLHRRREGLLLREKVRFVLDLQRICLPLLQRQRPLAPWERPWSVEP